METRITLTHLISTLYQGPSDQSSEIFGCSHEPFAALASRWHGCILWAAYQLLTAIHTNNTARDTEQGKGQKTVLTGQQTTCPRSLLKLLFHRTSLDFSKTE